MIRFHPVQKLLVSKLEILQPRILKLHFLFLHQQIHIFTWIVWKQLFFDAA